MPIGASSSGAHSNLITRLMLATGVAGFLWQSRVMAAGSAYPLAESTISIAAAGTRYGPALPSLLNDGGSAWNANEALVLCTVTRACTITGGSIRVATNANTSNGTFVLRKNGADTALTATITAGQVGVFSLAGAAVSFAAGDTMALKIVSGATGAITVGNHAVSGYEA